MRSNISIGGDVAGRRSSEMAARRRVSLFTCAAAKYLAVAMAYDDVARVADLKIRESRRKRVRREVKCGRRYDRRDHRNMFIRAPRSFALAAKAWGEWIETPRRFSAGSQASEPGAVDSHRHGELAIWRSVRRQSRPPPPKLASSRPRGGASRGLARRRARGAGAPLLIWALEVLACRRLVKGYSDTHARPCRIFEA